MLIDLRETGRAGEKEKERNIESREKHWSVASCTCPDQDRARHLGMCPDQALNLSLSGLQDNAQPTKPHQPGLCFCVNAPNRKTHGSSNQHKRYFENSNNDCDTKIFSLPVKITSTANTPMIFLLPTFRIEGNANRKIQMPFLPHPSLQDPTNSLR